MLKDIKNDLMYLLNMVEAIEKIMIYSKDFFSAEEFFDYEDQLNFNATLSLFTLIGENAGKISNELKENYNNILWKDVKNFRNKIVHDYVNIDMFIVFDIIKNNLYSLKENLEELLKNKLKDGTFDIEEYKVSIGSKYYRHIDFKKINDYLEIEKLKMDN
jgi:uncharacterized protein with HEPN domain